MLKWLTRRRIDAFERQFGYDARYMHEILDTDPRAALSLGRLTALSGYRAGVPVAPWFAAKITAALDADCGPCVQLVVTMAEQSGVDPAILEALIAGDEGALPEQVALAARYARAVLARDMEAEPRRERIHALWGQRGVISLAYGIAAAQLYPTLKAGLGHASACVRVTVGGSDLPVLREAA